MALKNLDVIDFISIDLDGNAVLTISDEFPWEDNDHLVALQNKLNAYLQFIEDDRLYQAYPKAKDRNIVINIVAKYDANFEGRSFLKNLKNTLETAGYGFKFSVL